VWTGLTWLRKGTGGGGGGSCEQGDEPSGSIEDGKYLEELSNC
jgi:hypothetical protein